LGVEKWQKNGRKKKGKGWNHEKYIFKMSFENKDILKKKRVVKKNTIAGHL
jgi:hypothetical protein